MGNNSNSKEKKQSIWEVEEFVDEVDATVRKPGSQEADLLKALGKFPRKKGSGDKSAEQRTPAQTPPTSKKIRAPSIRPFRLRPGRKPKFFKQKKATPVDEPLPEINPHDKFRRVGTDNKMEKQATIVNTSVLNTTYGGEGSNALVPNKKVVTAEEHQQWLQKKQERLFRVTTKTPLAIQGGFKNFFARLSFNIHERINESTRGTGRKQVSRQAFIAFCKKFLGENADTYAILKLFDYMDVDKNGFVDDIEFSIVSGFLLSTSSNSPNVDLAFHLFDANKDNVINQQEFSELLATVVGNSVHDLLNNDLFKDLFEEFLNNELMHEAIAFYKVMKPLYREKGGEKLFVAVLVSEAEDICKKFLENEAPFVINVAEWRRLEAINKVNEHKAAGLVSMDASVFEACFEVVSHLLRTNGLPRFKAMLRTHPYSDITSDLWDDLGKNPEEEITKEEFGEWVLKNEHVFLYFDKLRMDLKGIVDNLFETGYHPVSEVAEETSV